MYIVSQQQEKLSISDYIGATFLLLGIPLLIWQSFPEHQLFIPFKSDFLVAHTIMETFAVIVASLIFFIAYGTRNRLRSLRVIILACAFLAAAFFDVFHFLSYQGMPDFISINSPNKSILFWLFARLAVAAGLLFYVLLSEYRITYGLWVRLLLPITLFSISIITYLILDYPYVFPSMFVPGEGLSFVKVVMEWLVFGIYVVTASLLYWRRQRIVNCNVNSLILALILLAIGELFFTMYVQVSNTANFFGHVYKVIGYYYLYRAILSETVHQPYQQIQKMINYDELTGLASRSAFNEKLNQQLGLSKRNRTHFAVLLMGLDNFKTVNATLGHEQGDLLLMAVAERIYNVLPKSAFVARFSGDMFSILLRQTNINEATQLGYSMLRCMESVFKLGNDNIEIGASMGIVVYPEDGESASDLIRHADVSLHKAKSDGRNCVVVFSHELSESINRCALISTYLKQAIYKNEFYLLYQPKVDLLTEKICGWEALLRWRSPELGEVSPSEFIPVAEENGLILEIGDWVLRDACKQIRAWREDGLSMGSVAVNLSARQFRQKDLVERISSTLLEEKINANDITLEITESAIMDNPISTASMLKQLGKIGIYTAIDDFGTGHSSLSYLKTFPIHTLKIDRSFIHDIPGDENDLAIVRSILSLGKSLGLSVVAEGVETEEQLEYLRMEKCDIIQGYLYSRPISANKSAALKRSEINE